VNTVLSMMQGLSAATAGAVESAASAVAPALSSAVASSPPAGAAPSIANATNIDFGQIPLLLLGLPLLGAVLSVLCAIFKVRSKAPAFLMVLCLAGAFGVAGWMYYHLSGQPLGSRGVVHAFEWINFAYGQITSSTGAVTEQRFVANFSLYIDSLTCLWMMFVTGLATLIALYASEYMSHDVGRSYCRFFFAFGLFVFSMACLVMADNLVLLYLGWEGVGLCSYLLIGYFYQKPSAVAAAKKAFIVNRIGDLGLALGILLAFVQFGTVEYAALLEKVKPFLALAAEGKFSEIPATVEWIAILLMIGAFGKSAQFPLYVWLPDAMEGPTPVSALIHAATMVTAGVYLIARMLPFFQVSEFALPIVAWTGAITALLAATIGMAQFDIKRIMAYSTVSQLGYMFAGLGVLSATSEAGAAAGSAFHVFTHAFFKATLFLSCGAVMHGFAGQLDLRKLSGVMWMKGWTIVGLAMLVGCINLAGVPFTAGYFSKDMILAGAFSSHSMQAIGWILLLTAGLTAYYTFRVWFRVFMGPKSYEPGDELHAHGDDHGHGHGHGGGDSHHAERGATPENGAKKDHAHDFHPHPPGWAINLVLSVLALASLAAAALYFFPKFGESKWIEHVILGSSARLTTAAGEHAHATIFGFDPHAAMYYISAGVGAIGILVAFMLHYVGRTTAAKSNADALLPAIGPIAKAAQNKWYVDEIYNALIRLPLLTLGHIFHVLDKFVVDGLVNLFGWIPRAFGWMVRPSQSGQLHGYAVGMACGVAVLVVIAVMAMM
jgi:NADH-quinone oxidoreductase subunit L